MGNATVNELDSISQQYSMDIFRAMLYVGVAITLFFSIYDAWAGRYLKASGELAAFLLFLTVSILLRRKKLAGYLFHAAMLVGAVSLLGIMAFSPVASSWLAIIPLVVLEIFGRKAGTSWLLVFMIGGVCVLVGDQFREHPLYSSELAVNIVASIIVIGFMVHYAYRRAEEMRKALLRETTERGRLEVAQTLAGGMAHLINNSLQPALGYAEMLRMDMPDNAGEHVQRIIDSVEKASGHTKHLLAYAHDTTAEVREFDPAALLTALAEETLPGHIHFRVETSSPIRCAGDPIKISQAMLAMLENAREAIEIRHEDHPLADSEPKGIIAVAICMEMVRKDCGVRGLKAGRYVHISIKDDGCGVSPSLHNRIFDPLFSTRFLGRGMGLAVAQRIVRSHGGHIGVKSTGQDGSVFHVWLPEAANASPAAT